MRKLYGSSQETCTNEKNQTNQTQNGNKHVNERQYKRAKERHLGSRNSA